MLAVAKNCAALRKTCLYCVCVCVVYVCVYVIHIYTHTYTLSLSFSLACILNPFTDMPYPQAGNSWILKSPSKGRKKIPRCCRIYDCFCGRVDKKDCKYSIVPTSGFLCLFQVTSVESHLDGTCMGKHSLGCAVRLQSKPGCL